MLVGHSYGGFVITNAATGAKNVKALVYVDAFIPDEGQPAVALTGAGSALAAAVTNPTSVFKLVPIPGAPPEVVDTYLLPSVVAESFANDVSAEDAALIHATQRPASIAGLAEPSGPPAWKDIPAWAVIGTQDKIIAPDSLRAMAEHAGAKITEVDASHVSMVSDPMPSSRSSSRRCARSGSCNPPEVLLRNLAGRVRVSVHPRTRDRRCLAR